MLHLSSTSRHCNDHNRGRRKVAGSADDERPEAMSRCTTSHHQPMRSDDDDDDDGHHQGGTPRRCCGDQDTKNADDISLYILSR